MKKQKEKAGFGPGHFPVGTIARVEICGRDPANINVVRIIEQSAQGWLLETDAPPSPHTGKETINSNWVTAIIKRGTGNCFVHQWHPVQKFTDRRYEKDFTYVENRQQHGARKGEYVFTQLEQQLREIILARYPAQAQVHLFDMTAIAGAVIANARSYRWYATIINKKKFNRVLKQSMARFKQSRAACEKAYCEEQNRWGEELMRDMHEYDESQLDDDDRALIAKMEAAEEPEFDPLLQEPGVAYRESEQ